MGSTWAASPALVMGRALHKGRQGRQVLRSTWRWPGLQELCDDSAQRQPNWPGAQACRVPVWGKHLLRRAPPGPQLERTATLSESVPGFVLSHLVLGGVSGMDSLSVTHLRLSPQPSHPPLSVPNNLSHIPWALPWCGFPTEGQKQRLNFREIASHPDRRGGGL